MRKFKLLIVLTAVMAALPAVAQLRFGVKAGADFNSLDATVIEYTKNKATSFTGGVMAEFTVPLIGIGIDASVMYTRRNVPRSVAFMQGKNDIMVEPSITNKDYLEIPVNLKYKLSVPAISSIVKPYIATGPSIAFTGKDDDTPVKVKNTSLSWNLGGGVEIIKHIQVGFCYRWDLGKINDDDLSWTTRHYDFKSNGWRVTAAYLF